MRRAAGFWLGWWVALAGLWLALDYTVAVPEVIAGAVAAALGASASTAVRAQRQVGSRFRTRWLGLAWRPFAQIAPDTWLLATVLWQRLVVGREVGGSFRAVAFRASDKDRSGPARRALAEGFGSVAPNTYVIGIDHEHDLMLVHQLVATPGNWSDVDPLELG